MVQYVLYKKEINKFIGYSETRKIIHVSRLENAHKFNTPTEARNARKRASKRMYNFCVYVVMENGSIEKLSDNIQKRKTFSKEERMRIYRKTKGHCYLCGEFVDFDKFEIEHKVPVSKGGTNDFNNVFCSCHVCNAIKQDIYPEDFVEKISKIFMYQMNIKNRKCLKWRIVHSLLCKMV